MNTSNHHPPSPRPWEIVDFLSLLQESLIRHRKGFCLFLLVFNGLAAALLFLVPKSYEVWMMVEPGFTGPGRYGQMELIMEPHALKALAQGKSTKARIREILQLPEGTPLAYGVRENVGQVKRQPYYSLDIRLRTKKTEQGKRILGTLAKVMEEELETKLIHVFQKLDEELSALTEKTLNQKKEYQVFDQRQAPRVAWLEEMIQYLEGKARGSKIYFPDSNTFLTTEPAVLQAEYRRLLKETLDEEKMLQLEWEIAENEKQIQENERKLLHPLRLVQPPGLRPNSAFPPALPFLFLSVIASFCLGMLVITNWDIVRGHSRRKL